MAKIIVADTIVPSGDNELTEFQGRAGYLEQYTIDQIGDDEFVPKRLINFDTPLLNSRIQKWDETLTYQEDDAVRKLVDGVWYLFASNSDDNTTEPVLNGTPTPWTKYGRYTGTWNSSTTFLAGNIVQRTTNERLYQAKIDTDTDPLINPENWDDRGHFAGIFDPAYPGGYTSDDAIAVLGPVSGFDVYGSNVDNNTYPLDTQGSFWDLIGVVPDTEARYDIDTASSDMTVPYTGQKDEPQVRATYPDPDPSRAGLRIPYPSLGYGYNPTTKEVIFYSGVPATDGIVAYVS